MDEKISGMRYAIGIDMGGTNTAFGLVDVANGKIVARGNIPTSGNNVTEYVTSLAEAVDDMVTSVGVGREVISGVGMCAPCADYRSGVIEDAVDLPWPSPIPMGKLLSERLGVPVRLSNDANAAAMGEMLYGAARGMKDFIELTLGTGVGSGIVCDGHLLTGHRGFAGELGHCHVNYKPRLCSCGRMGCLQTYASAKGVVETAHNIRLSLKCDCYESLTAQAVGEAADHGEAWALETLELTGEVLGIACADFVAFSDPEAIILFGGVAKSFRHIAPAMEKALHEKALGLYHGVKILESALSQGDVAILGASALGDSTN